MRFPFSRPLALATLTGVLYFAGFVHIGQWYLTFVCLVPLIIALADAQNGKQAFLWSWWAGFVKDLGGYYWLSHMLEQFAGFPKPLAIFGMAVFCAGQGALHGAFGWLAYRLHRRTGIALGWIAPWSLIAAEFAFPLIFPDYLANSLAYVPVLTQTAELGGVLLVSAIAGMANGAVAELLLARRTRRRPHWALPAVAAAALVGNVAYGAIRIPQVQARDAAATHVKTAIIQANVGAGDKHLRAWEGIARYRRMTEDALGKIKGLGLIVWPESALNRYIIGRPNLTGQLARDIEVPMIIGTLREEPDNNRMWNTSFAVEPGGKIVGHYDKTALLVFGEYVPGDQIFPWIYRFLPYSSHYERGTTRAPLPVGPYRLSTNICYEDILPAHVRGLMAETDAAGQPPHAMVNLTNDSWYGPTEPPIHLALATFRSIEHRRWTIRSTATGISTFIDSTGRLVSPSKFETQETLVADVPMVSAGRTVYAVIGDLLGWIALLAAAAALALPRRTLERLGLRSAPEPAPAAAEELMPRGSGNPPRRSRKSAS